VRYFAAALGVLVGTAAGSEPGGGPGRPPPAPVATALLRLGGASSPKDLPEAVRGLPEILASVDAATRDAARRELRAALLAARDRLAARIRRDVESLFRDRIPALQDELARRRESAASLIMDVTAYPDGEAGNEIQPRVDEKVAAVRELWENPLLALGRLTPAVAVDIEALNAAVAAAQEAARLESGPGDAVRLDTLLADPGDSVRTFRSAPVNAAEAKRIAFNRQSEAFNARVEGICREALEQVAVTNAYREMMGMRILQIEPKLCRAAQGHSETMARLKKIFHQGEDGTPATRIAATGYESTAIAENVGGHLADARAAHGAWYRSPPHHRNLINALYNQIGVGYADSYWTQNYGRGRLNKMSNP
jgi:uncharacterized protein YkwD